MENVIFFSDTASLNTTVCECNNFNIGTVMQFKRSFASCTKWAQIESFALINTSLFLLQLSFGCNPAFYFNMGKKLERHISFSCTCSCRYRKHPNNDNNICALESSACFQQHFDGWFTVLSYNSYLKKFEWTPLLLTLTKSMIYQRDANCSPFCRWMCFLFSTLRTELLQFNIIFF